MSEVVEKKSAAKRKPRPRPTKAVDFTVWATNGEPLSDLAVKKIEDAIQVAQVELFNDGIRILTQTSRA